MIREVVSEPMAVFERAHFFNYGEWSLNFEVVYHFQSPDYIAHMDTQQAILLEIYRRFEREGIQEKRMKKNIAIVGAGFSGAVIANQLAHAGYTVEVFESRPHIAGNCHSERDAETGVMVHVYGPHIFHTDNERAWEFVNRYAEFKPYVNRVKAITNKRVYTLPINLLTINQFFGKTFRPAEAEEFLESLGDKTIENPQTFEEQALRFVGRELYEAFFKTYTIKQWGLQPSELPASILKRLPVRFNYDDNYFNHKYQGMPADGYTALVENILNVPGVTVHLNTRFDPDQGRLRTRVLQRPDRRLVQARRRPPALPHAGLRSLPRHRRLPGQCRHQLLRQRPALHPHHRAQALLAVGKARRHDLLQGIQPPVRREGHAVLPDPPGARKGAAGAYVNLAREESNVTFVGRLGTYRYLDMDVTINEALVTADKFLEGRCAHAGVLDRA
jgi:UDP-galactopyranose mutase